MYVRRSAKQPEFPNFYLPFNGRLDPSNRWVRFAGLIPWADLESKYSSLFSEDEGRPALSVRVAFGALIIKAYLDLNDRETVRAIQENVYLQFFLGYREFIQKEPFDPSMMVHFRRRFDLSLITEIQDQLEKSELASEAECDNESRGNDAPQPPKPGEKKNRGKLLIDATVAPADIRYPRDVDILNEAREKSERIIDELHKDSMRRRVASDC